jgi:cytochrome c-type biogenesis protein CcmH/NrfF
MISWVVLHSRLIAHHRFMQLPPFTTKSVLLWLVGAAAVLLGTYFLISALINSTPKQTIPEKQTSYLSNAVLNPTDPLFFKAVS